MTTDLLFFCAIAAGVVAAGLYLVYRWGPGVARRRVRCPEKKTQAQVAVLRKEGSFGALVEADVISCSLLPEGPIDCSKKCLPSR